MRRYNLNAATSYCNLCEGTWSSHADDILRLHMQFRSVEGDSLQEFLQPSSSSFPALIARLRSDRTHVCSQLGHCPRSCPYIARLLMFGFPHFGATVPKTATKVTADIQVSSSLGLSGGKRVARSADNPSDSP